jgi:hypothetical protein
MGRPVTSRVHFGTGARGALFSVAVRALHARNRTGAPSARQTRRNRQFCPVLHISFRAPAREKWCPTVNLALQTPRDGAALRERKVWQPRVSQSSAAGSEHGKMALWAPERVPFCAIFRPFFVDFPRVFLASLPVMALGARMRPRNAFVVCRASGDSCFPPFLLSSSRLSGVPCAKEEQIRQRAQSENVNLGRSFLRSKQADPSLGDETARPRRAQKLQ